MRDLVPFALFKKRENTHREVSLSVKLQAYFLFPHQNSLLTLSEFKRTNYFIFPDRFSDEFRRNTEDFGHTVNNTTPYLHIEMHPIATY